MPVRRQQPIFVPRTSYHSAPGNDYISHDYGIDNSINRAEYFSNAVMEDTYDAAAKSRGRDYELLRNANAAIHPTSTSGETQTGRQSKRFQSVPPMESGPRSPETALVPYRRHEVLRSLSSAPTPTSLLSSRINTFLRGSSVPPAPLSGNNSISYKSFLMSSPKPLTNDIRDNVSYRSYLTDPSIFNPLSTRSSSKLYRGYIPSTLTRSLSTGRYGGLDYDSVDEDDEYEPVSYRRKYRIMRGREPLSYSRDTYENEDDEDNESCYGRPNGLGRANSVPVSSYRSRLDDGQSHRVDVYPLVVSESSVPADKKIHLPIFSGDSASRLSVLEKINIKAAIIGSKMEADDGGRRYKRPRSQFAANRLREFSIDDIERRYK